jgi:lysophospholipase L1-like esterase
MLAAGTSFAAETGPTPYPDPQNESAWPGRGPIRFFPWMPENRSQFWARHEQDRGAVVFVGDSLTQGWRNLAQNFPALKVANRGIGGDTTRGVLFRFSEDVLDLQPRAIVLLVGTNDLSAHADPAASTDNLATMIALARARNPVVPIVLCTIPPRDAPQYPTAPGAQADLNARIKQLAASHERVAVVDLSAGMNTAAGDFDARYFGKDRLHLAEPGYERWAELLRPAFEQLGIK